MVGRSPGLQMLDRQADAREKALMEREEQLRRAQLELQGISDRVKADQVDCCCCVVVVGRF